MNAHTSHTDAHMKELNERRKGMYLTDCVTITWFITARGAANIRQFDIVANIPTKAKE